MASKKDNLPLSLEQDKESVNTITYANEVIAIISGVAANEVEGIAGMCASGGINEVFSRNKNITKGVKVEIGSEEAAVDLYVVVEYGTPIQKAATDVQESVRKAIETMTGLHVVRVDVHVQGVSFEKENQVNQEGIDNAVLDNIKGLKDPTDAPVAEDEPPVQEEPVAEEPTPQEPEAEQQPTA